MIKWLKRMALWLLFLVGVGIGTGWWLMHGSLPTLDGELALEGLSADELRAQRSDRFYAIGRLS